MSPVSPLPMRDKKWVEAETTSADQALAELRQHLGLAEGHLAAVHQLLRVLENRVEPPADAA